MNNSAWKVCAPFSAPHVFCRNKLCICCQEEQAALGNLASLLTPLGRAQALCLQLRKPPAA